MLHCNAYKDNIDSQLIELIDVCPWVIASIAIYF